MSKKARNPALYCRRVAGGGQLLRPDEDTFASPTLVIDDQRRAETFEVLHGEFHIAQIHLMASDVHPLPTHLEAQQQERDVHLHHASLVGIEHHDVE